MKIDINILSFYLTILTIFVTFLIAIRQGKESKKTQSISKETKSIAERLSTDRMVSERVRNLFPLNPKAGLPYSIYQIAYAVKYSKRPLPFINQGDFYAIHILSLALGEKNVQLKELDPNLDVVSDEKNVSNAKNINSNIPQGNFAFICGPQSNTILNDLYPFASIFKNQGATYPPEKLTDKLQCYCKDRQDLINWLKEIKLPCWFIDEYQNPKENKDSKEIDIDSLRKIKKIQIYDKDDEEYELQMPMESAAEECYRKAKYTEKKVPFGKVEDYGIFGRITKNSDKGLSRIIIVSGLHQYGTWIISDYINKIIRRERDSFKDGKYLDIFQDSELDFISVIRGSYSSSTMTVEYSEIDGDKLWVRQKKMPWVRYKRYVKKE
jgi:hypothetical protein